MQSNSSEQQTYELIAEWLENYHRVIDEKQKAKYKALIVTRMIPIVKRIARTIARRSYDPIEDLVQAGSIGLLKAIDSYSSTVSDNFKIYAGCLIIGEMKHYLRDKLNTIKVPRHIQELSYRINTFISTLTSEELNDLTNDYVAEALNVSTKDVAFAIQSERRKTTLSLDDIYNSDSASLGYEEVIAKDNYKETAELEDTKLVLDKIIKMLPDEYKKIIELYYYKDMNQKEIADALELSQMQVSRKLKKACNLLSQKIDSSGFVL